MNTKKILFGICTCLILMAAACTSDSDDLTYEDAVNKKHIKDQSSVNKKHIKDQSSVNKKHIKNQAND